MRVSKTQDGHIAIDVENGHGSLTVTQVDAVSLHKDLGILLGRQTYVVGLDMAAPFTESKTVVLDVPTRKAKIEMPDVAVVGEPERGPNLTINLPGGGTRCFTTRVKEKAKHAKK